MMKLMQIISSNTHHKNDKPKLQMLQWHPTHVKEKGELLKISQTFFVNLNQSLLKKKLKSLHCLWKKLGLYDLFQFQRKPTKTGRKVTSHATRQAVWDFWHCKQFIIESTLTSRPAKLKITNKPKIQNGLEYKVPVSTIVQRSCEFFEAPWCIFQNTLKELHRNLDRNPNHSVSWGTFLALKPFYVRTATSKDVEMCVCKLHLHARWAVKALVNLRNENDTDLNGITMNLNGRMWHRSLQLHQLGLCTIL